MAWHHVNAVPARFKERMEARIRATQRETDAVIAGLFDLDIKINQLWMPAALPQFGIGFDGLDGVDDVIGVEFLAVAPHHARAQFDRHLGEVVIVDGVGGRQRVDEIAGFLIAVPECLQHQRMMERR